MNLIKITLPEDGVEKLINQCGIEFFMHDLASFKSLYKKGLFPQRILIELLKEELNENNMKYILFVLSSKKSVDYSSYTPLDALLIRIDLMMNWKTEI